MENRPGCYWWWMGSAVDEGNLTWNFENLKAAGMGGVTIVPIYGVKGCEDRNIPYLSPKWLKMLDHTVKEGERLGIWVDMSTGTGWPFGGPSVGKSDADSLVAFRDGKLQSSFSGRAVKRAAPGGKGMSLNPYSPAAMSRYLEHFDKAFGSSKVRLPRAQYHDSFEYAGNWSPVIPAVFKEKHGYDLMEHLPALFGQGDADTVARIKSDYRETLSDCHLAYVKTWVGWSEGKGMTTRNQAHGAPANLLDLYAASGIPETETFGATPFEIPGIRREKDEIREDVPQPLINRMASSAAHVAGKPLVAAETCTWVRNHFRSALSHVKPEVDQLFLAGINHIFFHGTCYSPKDAAWPGWLFYASLQYNPRNAFWRDAPLLNDYVTRCQSILQSGKPDNDVAVYWPVYDIWHSPDEMQQMLTVHHPQWLTESPCGQAAASLVKQGFGFDFISDRQLQQGLAKSHAVIVVPKTGHMPVETLRNLLARADGGQPVVFLDAMPADVPGYARLTERRAALQNLLKGRESLVVPAAALRERLAKTSVAREAMVDSGLDFVRRSHPGGYHYFVANMGSKPVDAWIPLGRPFASVVMMDPRSSITAVARQRDRNQIHLQLDPGETRILRSVVGGVIQGPAWPSLETMAAPPVEVTGQWRISFIDGAPTLPEPVLADRLKSWTELGGDETRRFAGTARYSIDFEAAGHARRR